MKKYIIPIIDVCTFESEDVIMISAATTQAAVSTTIGADMVADGYEFVSSIAAESPVDVQAGAVFSWN